MRLTEESERRLGDVLARIEANMPARDGRADQAQWSCEDGYIVVYTTSRIEGGPHDGKFATMLYTPRGKGSRSGTAVHLHRTYLRAFSTRKAAKQRALQLYYRHSPKAAARHRWNGKGYGPRPTTVTVDVPAPGAS